MNANGSHQRVSPLHHYGTWSSTGTHVAYSNGSGGYVAKGDGSDPHRVARLPADPDNKCFAPDWSPNAEQLAFVTQCGIDAANLVVERADFTNRRRLAKGFRTLRPRWSPDGRTILFAGRAPGEFSFAFYVVRPDGDGPERIPGFTFDFTYARDTNWEWSRDGKTIFALLETHQLFAVPRGGGRARLLAPKLTVAAFDLSPDGARIVLQAQSGLADWEIYVMRSDGTHLRQLTHNGSQDTAPTWSPRGDKIAFVSERNGNCCADIYVMKPDGTAGKGISRVPARSGRTPRAGFLEGSCARKTGRSSTSLRQTGRCSCRTDSPYCAERAPGSSPHRTAPGRPRAR